MNSVLCEKECKKHCIRRLLSEGQSAFNPLDTFPVAVDMLYSLSVLGCGSGPILTSILKPSNASGYFHPKYNHAKIFENHLNPVMLVFTGQLSLSTLR